MRRSRISGEKRRDHKGGLAAILLMGAICVCLLQSQSALAVADPLNTSSVQIQSGTGSFSSISPSNKEISVIAGGAISGSVTMTTINGLDGSVFVPLIGTPSWGVHPYSYWTVDAGIGSGTRTYISSGISLVAPENPGTYYIIFAFQAEMTAAQVASSTDWRVAGGSPTWYDGNDVADFRDGQITEIQSTGRTTVGYMLTTGFANLTEPADAITVNVQYNASNPLYSSYINIQSGTGDFSSLSPQGTRIFVDAGATISGSVNMNIMNGMNDTLIAPVIGVTTWGDHSTSYWTVSDYVDAGSGSYTAYSISLTAPMTPGTYFVIFCFHDEQNAAQVASSTAWSYVDGTPVWDDGNDVADLSLYDIVNLQNSGYTSIMYLTGTGYFPSTLPADAIELVVRDGTSNPWDVSYVKIQSGTGDFSSISPEKKQISVIAGSTISGEVIMSTLNGMNESSTAPLIGTTSWGDHSTSYWTVNGAVLWGDSVYNSSVSVTAPTTPGKYYLIFSFNTEMDGAYVASSTNSMKSNPVWNDGNDLAGLNSSYIMGMQISGKISLLYLMQYGYTPWICPADAITVIVQNVTLDTLYDSSVKIQSGTGDFSSISPSMKVISVTAGSTISGEVIMATFNGMNESSTAPLIGTTSWGDHSTSYWTVNGGIVPGNGTYNSTVCVNAPMTPGTYYLLFSFNTETNGAQVASSTNWGHGDGSPVWNDGNDLAGLNASYIYFLQSSGRTSLLYLMPDGLTPWTCPGDAITVIVSASTKGIVSGHVTDADGNPIANATVTLDSGPSSVTDANGLFSFNITQGNYSMTISKVGFQSRQMPVSIAPGLTSEIGGISVQEKVDLANQGIDLNEVIIAGLVACLVAMVCVMIILERRNSRS